MSDETPTPEQPDVDEDQADVDPDADDEAEDVPVESSSEVDEQAVPPGYTPPGAGDRGYPRADDDNPREETGS